MKKTFNASANTVASFLKNTFNLKGDGAKKVLQGAGFAASQVDNVLKDIFKWPPFIKVKPPFIKVKPPFIKVKPPFVKLPHIKVKPPHIKISAPHIKAPHIKFGFIKK